MDHFEDRSDFSKNFSKVKNNFDLAQMKSSLHEESNMPALMERKDFNNIKAK
jgi:hypothetical protein